MNQLHRFLYRKLTYQKEQIASLAGSKLSIFGGNLFVPLLFIAVYYDKLPHNILYIWFGMQVAIFFARSIFAARLLKNLPSMSLEEANQALKKYMVFIAFYAFLWGGMGFFVVNYVPNMENDLYFILLMGMTAAAISSLSSVFHALVVYIVSLVTPLFVSYLFFGTTYEHILLAIFAILYMFFILMIGFNTFKTHDLLHKQQEELKLKNRNFQNLLDITIEAIVVSTQEFKIIDINKSGVSLFKAKDKEDAIGRSVVDFVVPEYIPVMQNAIKNEVQEPYEMRLKKIGGETFPALISSRDIYIDNEKVRVATVMDLTQLKEKEKQLLHQSRLAQMGEMIGMIAHQWRQPLTAISSSANTLALDIMMDNYDKAFFEEQVNNIAEYAQHLSSTIDDFRNFFKQKKEKQKFTLEEIVDNTISIIGSSLENKGIVLKKGFKAYKEVESYPNELKQVVLNLIKNAEDILLEKEIKEPWIRISTFMEGNKVVLTVADNAGGVPEEIMEKIFDPYFSTKLEKDGTGLGLYMSKTIIDEHCKGRLTVSNDTFGAVFRVELEYIDE